MPKQAMGSKKLNVLPFDSTIIRFDLEHHLLLFVKIDPRHMNIQ